MIRSEKRQVRICENDMLHIFRYRTTHNDVRTYLEVVNDALPVQEVVRDGKEIPVESFAPWVPSPRFRVTHVALLEREECRDLAVYQRLADHDKYDHICMSHEQQR